MSYAVLVVLYLLFTQDVWSLKLKKFSVPVFVMRGEPAWLNCSYDLENDVLYSIKWHKDQVEFYRYLPADTPPGQKYDLPGIHLDLSRSEEGNIFLSKTDVDSAGIYRCEVSTEDLFQTVRGESEMRIYVNPSSPPKTRGTKMHYLTGETVNATCISAPSRPAAILKWWINGKEARKEQLYGPKITETADGLFISKLFLAFKITLNHIRHGRMRLVCEAITSQVHTIRSAEKLISNKASSRSIISDYGSLKNSPTIIGVKDRYQFGDKVDIECKSSKFQPAAELHWYINDKEVKPEYLIPQNPIHYIDGTVSTVLGLRFEVKHRHFQKEPMRLRCTETLSKIMRMKSDPLEAEISERHMSDWFMDGNTGSAIYCQRKCILQRLIFMVLSYLFSQRLRHCLLQGLIVQILFSICVKNV